MIANSCAGHAFESRIPRFVGFLRSEEGLEQALLLTADSV